MDVGTGVITDFDGGEDVIVFVFSETVAPTFEDLVLETPNGQFTPIVDISLDDSEGNAIGQVKVEGQYVFDYTAANFQFIHESEVPTC